jgi:hypothetical protein
VYQFACCLICGSIAVGMRRTVWITVVLTTMLSLAPRADAQEKSSDAWRQLGQTTASFLADHDMIIVQPPYDNFHRIKFRVADAPLTLVRVVALYDEGEPDRVDLRERIEPNGESRVIALESADKRNLRKVEFWYEVASARGSVRVTVFGMK